MFINFSETLVKVKVKLGFFALPKVIKERSIGGEDTHLYFDRDRIPTWRESETKDLPKKTEEQVVRSLSFIQLGRTLT